MPELTQACDTDEIHCPGCGEPTSKTARTVDKHYRGNYHYCRNGGCEFCDTAIAVTPPTLCDHPETKLTPSATFQPSYPYCARCGRLQRDWGKGYERTVAPWDRP